MVILLIEPALDAGSGADGRRPGSGGLREITGAQQQALLYKARCMRGPRARPFKYSCCQERSVINIALSGAGVVKMNQMRVLSDLVGRSCY